MASDKKSDRLLILRKIIERENFPFVQYDGGKILYSIELLTGLPNGYQINILDKESNREQNIVQ